MPARAAVPAARDLVQEAFVRLWRMRDRVRMETVEALVFRITVNLAANRRRQRKVWQWVTLDGVRGASAAAAAEEALTRAEEVTGLRAAIDALPEGLRRVLVLCDLGGLSYEQCGAVLGIPAGTVGSRRNTALRRLERALGATGARP